MEQNSSQLSLEKLSVDLITDLEPNRRAFFISARDELRGHGSINVLTTEKPSFLSKFFATSDDSYDENELREEYKKKCHDLVSRKVEEIRKTNQTILSPEDINALEQTTTEVQPVQNSVERLVEQINDWFLPQYVEDSFEQTKTEDQKYKLMFGRGVGRAGYLATGAAAGWVLLKTPPFWALELPVDLALVGVGFVYPELKRFFVDRAYNKKLNVLVREAAQYDKKQTDGGK